MTKPTKPTKPTKGQQRAQLKPPVTRMIIIRIDDIINLFKDYLDETDIPADAKPLRLFLKPGDKKIGILCESTQWKPTSETPEIQVQFRLKRLFSPATGFGGGVQEK